MMRHEIMRHKIPSKGLQISLYIKDAEVTSRAEIEAVAVLPQKLQADSRLAVYSWQQSEDFKILGRSLQEQEVDQVLEREETPVGAWSREDGWWWESTYAP
ncbi:hypothetical protein CLAFUW4_07864 [Fulvia fulva]|uniref:Uncharacterized protein n=1 Tax=Passalora fulva TaxID=5499 RepID=A0A9Q8LD33_PASFU|nr:uncharacterized protein CLAFUR5_07989 [Fulvia fulva]KAK4629521.1 hypothetical protein CLAFUR4_07869 [Fulvia fulva]KAK4630008.1 hypothetical protein CLAFUR0_07866 [Fulvia fulva]UJO15154.1 hypothetical protein CLAFUR5_07989 [Fulvia fulva]WPV12671.1 hypothetical protein CLAFUW4_07864 [Fulvia fulva]WPV27139.1 hypothetical protein CLAFUW7_07865 [Fulvia fulva]